MIEQLKSIKESLEQSAEKNEAEMAKMKEMMGSEATASKELNEKFDALSQSNESLKQEIADMAAELSTGSKNMTAENNDELELKQASDWIKSNGTMDLTQATLSVTGDGGLLVPSKFTAGIHMDLAETSAFMPYANIQQVDDFSLAMRIAHTQATAGLVSELDARPETAVPVLRQAAMNKDSLYAEIEMTDELIAAKELNVLEFYRASMLTAMADKMDAVGWGGQGTQTILGLTGLNYDVAADGTDDRVLQVALTGALTHAKLIGVVNSLAPMARKRSTLFLGSQMFGQVLGLVDMDKPTVRLDASNNVSVLGSNVVEVPELPDNEIYFGSIADTMNFYMSKGMIVKMVPSYANPSLNKIYISREVGNIVKSSRNMLKAVIA